MTDNCGPFDFLAFDELAVDIKNFLEKNKPILIDVEAKKDEASGIRLSGLDVQDLEEVSMNTSEILTYDVKDLNSLENLKIFLNDIPDGNSRIKLFLNINKKKCEINIPKGYALDADHKEQLKQIDGLQCTPI